MNPSAASAIPLLQAKELSREFDDGHVRALRGVNFSIQEGEFVAITGPSGCGKSTLLQLLGALDRPTAGDLLYRGESIPNMPHPSRYRAAEIGFIFQAFQLLPTFTALENVQIPMFESARSRAERREQALALLKLVGLENRLDHFPSKLSGGERQRVAVGRALLMRPRLLLLDEPLASLDAARKHEILPYLERLRDEAHVPLIYVSHDAAEVRRIATRVVRLEAGVVTETGGVELLDATHADVLA
jgi:putative ABC transport system ATP-binding protein